MPPHVLPFAISIAPLPISRLLPFTRAATSPNQSPQVRGIAFCFLVAFLCISFEVSSNHSGAYHSHLVVVSSFFPLTAIKLRWLHVWQLRFAPGLDVLHPFLFVEHIESFVSPSLPQAHGSFLLGLLLMFRVGFCPFEVKNQN